MAVRVAPYSLRSNNMSLISSGAVSFRCLGHMPRWLGLGSVSVPVPVDMFSCGGVSFLSFLLNRLSLKDSGYLMLSIGVRAVVVDKPTMRCE